jgi:hypothetical protein
MSENMVEVELRGPVGEAFYPQLLAFCERRGELLANENRVLIDYSTFIEGVGSRRLDVRVRVTNGVVEIVVKEGAFGGASRKEASVCVQGNDLLGALRLMALLGYQRGVACDRGIMRYRIDDIEMAIQEVRVYGRREIVHSRFFEVEMICAESERAPAELRVSEFTAALNLRPFREEEWNTYVEELNQNANGVFDFAKDPVEYLSELGKAPV